MTEQPQFRTVLRGLDPDQVAAAVKDLHSSLVAARRTAADRTSELARLQEALGAAQRRVHELEGGDGASPRSFDDLGSRIGSMLRLAEEEAAQLRTEAQAEAGNVVAAAQESADALRAQADQETQARRAAALAFDEAHRAKVAGAQADLDRALAERRQQVEADLAAELSRHEARLAQAREEAAGILGQAQQEAGRLRASTERQLAEASAHRDQIHAHLGEVAAMIATATGTTAAEVPVGHEVTQDAPVAPVEVEARPQRSERTEVGDVPGAKVAQAVLESPTRPANGQVTASVAPDPREQLADRLEAADDFDDSFEGEAWAREEKLVHRR